MSRAPRNTLYLIFMLFISVVSLLLLAITWFLPVNDDVKTFLEHADIAICAIFFPDFLVSLRRAPNKWSYLRFEGLLDILSSIPVVAALRIGRVSRIVRIVRVLRAVRSTRALAAFVLERRAQSGILAAGMVAIVAIIFGSVAVLEFETVPESNIGNPGDAVWWSISTITAAGYGDRYPVTTEGRVVGVIIMLVGVMFLGVLSGFVAAWFMDPAKERQEGEIDVLRRKVDEIEQRREPDHCGEGL